MQNCRSPWIRNRHGHPVATLLSAVHLVTETVTFETYSLASAVRLLIAGTCGLSQLLLLHALSLSQKMSITTRSFGLREDWRHHVAEVHARIKPMPELHPIIVQEVHATALSPQAPSWSPGSSTFAPTTTLVVEVLEAGESERVPRNGDSVMLHYATLVRESGCCVDGSRSKAFSSRSPSTWTMGKGEVVIGMELGIMSLSLGTLARINVPSRYAPRACARACSRPASPICALTVTTTAHTPDTAAPGTPMAQLLPGPSARTRILFLRSRF